MSRRRLLISVGGACLLYGCLLAAAGQTSSTQNAAVSDLDVNYKNTTVKLWTPYCGQKLKFDASGTLVSGGEPGDWRRCQVMRIQHVAVQNGKLIVTARRVIIPADCATEPKPETGQAATEADDKAPSTNGPVNDERAVMEVELLPQSDGAAAMALMNKLFPPPVEPFSGGIFVVGQGVRPPVPVYHPNPSYSEEARQARYQGTVTLLILVGPDGKVYRPKVSRPLGMGLDEKAVEAVLKWRFKPATRCRMPVAVLLAVEIHFSI